MVVEMSRRKSALLYCPRRKKRLLGINGNSLWIIGILIYQLRQEIPINPNGVNFKRERRHRAMSKSEEFLKEAFAGESQANRRYLAFADKADQEGYPQVARLFRAAAEAETVHAHNHLRALKGIRSTRENLEEAIFGETHEFKSMYPGMIEAAKAEGNREAERSFNYANEVEKIHAQSYEKLMNTLGSSQETYPYSVCPVCGYTAEKAPPDVCPVCGAKGGNFKRID
jgi:rubrerythrin